MSARRYELRLADFSCGSRDMLLQVPTCDVQFRDCGLEFRSPFPLPLWVELEVELSRGPGSRTSVRQGVVVLCEPAGGGHNRVALLFVDGGGASPSKPPGKSPDNWLA